MRATQVSEAQHPSRANPPRATRAVRRQAAPFSASLLALQRSAGNRAVTSLIDRAPGRLPKRTLQRDIDISAIKPYPTGLKAFELFNRIDQTELTEDERRQLVVASRADPLIKRFATARDTTLLIRPEKIPGGGGFGTTSMHAHTTLGDLNPDRSAPERENFYLAIEARGVQHFTVQIVVDEPKLKTFDLGSWLQVLTHELTVHAEPMLDFIQAYWAYQRGPAGPPGGPSAGPPQRLLNTQEEHLLFIRGLVERYERIRRRAADLPEVAGGFSGRHATDLQVSDPGMRTITSDPAAPYPSPSGLAEFKQAAVWSSSTHSG